MKISNVCMTFLTALLLIPWPLMADEGRNKREREKRQRKIVPFPVVFYSPETGVGLGFPSGTHYHSVEKSPVITITVDADWGSVTAGELTLVLYYLS